MRVSHDAQIERSDEIMMVSAGAAWLVEVSNGRRHALATPLTMIGRSAPSHVALGADPYLSRRHAAIQRQEADWWFLDLQSANGSFINQRPVAGPQRLELGDVIQIGMTRLRFEGPSPVPTPPRDAQ